MAAPPPDLRACGNTGWAGCYVPAPRLRWATRCLPATHWPLLISECFTPGRGVWGPRPLFGPERRGPTLGDSYLKSHGLLLSSGVVQVVGVALGQSAGRGGGSGSHCSAFPGFSLVRGSSVTKRQGGTRPSARGTEGSGLGKRLLPASPWISAPFSGPSFLAHPWGSPCPPGEPPFVTPYRSVNASETDVLQRHVVDGGRARVPRCLERGGGSGEGG